MKKFLLVFCLSAAMLMSAAIAQADSVSWTYDVSVKLTDMVFGDGTTGKPYSNADGSTWYWGQGKPYSSLAAVGGSGSITSDGQIVNGITLTHSNNVLNGNSKTLKSGTIQTTVKLIADDDVEAYTVSNKLSFGFYETPNNGKGYDNDIFYMTSAQIMSSVAEFVYNGETYYVYLHATLQALEGEYLKMAQKNGGFSSSTQLYGWTTLEGGSNGNDYELKLVVSTTPPSVPVPAAVWLMGTGVAGLMAMKRRNKK